MAEPAFPLAGIPSDLYFSNRLGTLRRAPGLSASMQFDLARSPLDDDQIDEVSTAFGGNAGASGFGFAEAFRDMISREPKRVPVNDIAQLQQNLVDQGYAPATASPNGAWDPQWYAYFRRWDRDNYDKVLAGHHWGAAPLESGMRLIANTLPSAVWQGLVGSARGLVEQAPETAERVGLLGGAAGGAAIGATIGTLGGPLAPLTSTAGAIGGAIVGGAIGFLSDLFGEDPDEINQSVGKNLIDALSPFEEYSDPNGWRKFWEDVGFVGTATSLIAGAGMAAKGVGAAIGGIRTGAAAIEGSQLAGGFLAESTGVAVPSAAEAAISTTTAPKLTAALMRPATAEPGFATKLAVGALKKFSPGSAGWLEQNAIRFGPMAQMQRPAFQVVNKAFTGAVGASIGGRLSAGFDLGTGAVGQTTIEKAIVETDPLKSGISLPFLGDLVDWSSFVLVPERFLPWEAGAIGAAARRMEGDVAQWPWIHALQEADPSLTTSAAKAKIRGLVDAEKNTFARLDYGVHTEATLLSKSTGTSYATARADVIKRVHAEAEAAGPLATGENFMSEMAREVPATELPLRGELLARSVRDPEAFAGWLVNLPGEGINKFTNYADVQAASRKATRDARSGRYLVTETPQGFVATSTGLELGSVQGKGLEVASLKAEADKLKSQISTRTRQLARATDLPMQTRFRNEIEQLKAREKIVTDSLAKAEETAPRVGQVNVIAATEDFLTRKDLFAQRDQFNVLRQELESAHAGGLFEAQKVAQRKMNLMLSELGRDGVIPDRIVQETIAKGAAPGDAVPKFLEKEAQQAARDIALSPEDMSFFASKGYKPVVTGEDVLQLHEINQMAEVFGVGNYTKRANFMETLGLSPRLAKEENVFALKVAHERSELDNVFMKNDLPINGKNALTRIHRYLTDENRQGLPWGPLIKREGRALPHLPYVDPRQLSPEDLVRVFDDVPGFTEEHAAQVMGALKRGGALGAETVFKAPIVSARSLGHAMRVSGVPGFAEYIRTLKLPVTNKALSAAAGAVVGGAAGGLLGDEPSDIWRGAIGGAVLGTGYGMAARKTYGYLPDALARMNLALRYTFSVTFDMGRYSEAGMIAAAKYSLPVTFAPRRKLVALPEGMKTPYSEGRLVKGDELWQHAMKFQDELNGTVYFHGLEDTERRVFQAGMLGFKPRDFEAYYGMELYQRGWSREKIRDAVANINRYGVGRTAAEKTANFVFFPFSFSKKLLSSLGDFIFQAPGRNLLLTEGLRRYHDSSFDERFHDFIETKAPILKQLSAVNNLVYGLSPGRFFLEGLTDHRTPVGMAAQILASVLVPGGAATSFAAATGQAGDLALNAFIPVVITGESLDKSGGVDGLGDILRRYIPFIRELDQYAFQNTGGGGAVGGAIGEQWTALTSPTHETPYAQLTGYLDATRAWKEDHQALALASGYADIDGMMSSDLGAPLASQYDKLQNDLRLKYPQGWAMIAEIDNTDIINEAALDDLSRQVADGQASSAEENILLIQQKARFMKTLNAQIGMPADLASGMLGSSIRTMAKKYASDPRFLELYRRFFEREYGPIEVTGVIG